MAGQQHVGRSPRRSLRTVLKRRATNRSLFEVFAEVEEDFKSGNLLEPLRSADEQLVLIAYLGQVMFVLNRIAGEPPKALSPQQRRIAAPLLRGKPRKTIAYELGIGLGTVDSHIVRMYGKYGVSCTTELIQRLALLGQAELDGAQLLEIEL